MITEPVPTTTHLTELPPLVTTEHGPAAEQLPKGPESRVSTWSKVLLASLAAVLVAACIGIVAVMNANTINSLQADVTNLQREVASQQLTLQAIAHADQTANYSLAREHLAQAPRGYGYGVSLAREHLAQAPTSDVSPLAQPRLSQLPLE